MADVVQSIREQLKELSDQFPKKSATALEEYVRQKLKPAFELPVDKFSRSGAVTGTLVPFGQFPDFSGGCLGVFRVDHTNLDQFDKNPKDLYSGMVSEMRAALSLVPFVNTVVCDLILPDKAAHTLIGSGRGRVAFQKKNLVVAVDGITTWGSKDAATVSVWHASTSDVARALLHYERYLNSLK